jgi:predicted metal-dependent hydrolase
MKKQERMAALVTALPVDDGLALDPCYQGYFRCFNAGDYYEAHDVLEHLWLANGRHDANFAFYKGLIQVAGAFVHLKKQAARPEHAKDGRRLRPATRLFDLAAANLASYRPRHLGLDVDALCGLCARYAAAMAASEFTRNPWGSGAGPRLELGAL